MIRPLAVAALVLVGCPAEPPCPSLLNPANPNATEAPPYTPSAAPPASTAAPAHDMHDMPRMEGMPGMAMPSASGSAPPPQPSGKP